MYEEGELKFDSVGYFDSGEYITEKAFYLPHSCDEWIIGDIEHAKSLYKDLGEMINYYQQTSEKSGKDGV